ncbi:unnamed protein product, partial [Iphiclides podalirius]
MLVKEFREYVHSRCKSSCDYAHKFRPPEPREAKVSGRRCWLPNSIVRATVTRAAGVDVQVHGPRRALLCACTARGVIVRVDMAPRACLLLLLVGASAARECIELTLPEGVTDGIFNGTVLSFAARNGSREVAQTDVLGLWDRFPKVVVPVNGASEQCRWDSSRYLDALQRLELWALKMFDATAKPPSGILSGNGNQYGDFDECLDIDGAVRGKYCLASLQVTVEGDRNLEHLDNLIHSGHYLKSNVTDNSIDIKLRNEQKKEEKKKEIETEKEKMTGNEEGIEKEQESDRDEELERDEETNREEEIERNEETNREEETDWMEEAEREEGTVREKEPEMEEETEREEGTEREEDPEREEETERAEEFEREDEVRGKK